MKVGDMVREITRMRRKPCTGIVVKIDYTQWAGGVMCPYLVWFDDGETDWMKEGFLEVVK